MNNGTAKKSSFKAYVIWGVSLAALTIAAAWYLSTPGGRQLIQQSVPQTLPVGLLGGKLPLKLYFESGRTGELEAETREFTMPPAADPVNSAWENGTLEPGQLAPVLEQALNALISGPQTPGLVAVMPKETQLLGVYTDTAGWVYVNFDEKLPRLHPGGTHAEMITVYAVVNTICVNFPQLKRVKFMVAGQEIQTLAGHIDLRYPLTQLK